MWNPDNIKVGDIVKVKDHDWVGTVVGSGFGKPDKGMLRVQLSFGLTYDAFPAWLEKTLDN